MKKKLIIFDTTLRDGEQSPGASMTTDQKVEIACTLDNLGVNRIEAGFPVSSPLQREAVRKVGEAIKKATVVGLARCKEEDIDAVSKSLQNCPNKMIHVFMATSPLHMKYKLNMSKKQVLDSIEYHVKHAKKQGFELIEFSPEDASRSDWEFLVEALKTAVEAGANTLNIPDTVGYAMPDEYGSLMAALKKEIPELGSEIMLSAHCHNDLGLAVANSLAAIKAGADQVEVTLNGIGERAGNAAMEELVMGLKVRQDLWNVETTIKHQSLYPACKLLQSITGLMIPRNKPLFGENVFSHESGIHQHGVIKDRKTYEIMNPADIGRSSETLIMGRHSGKAALQKKLDLYNIKLNEEQMALLYERYSIIADMKKEVYDEDILSLASGILNENISGWQLISFTIKTGNDTYDIPQAKITMKKGEKEISCAKAGDGPVDAVFKAIDYCTGMSGVLTEYTIQAITPERDAQGQARLELDFNGTRVIGKSSSTDIIEASALAYINALNRKLLMDGAVKHDDME